MVLNNHTKTVRLISDGEKGVCRWGKRAIIYLLLQWLSVYMVIYSILFFFFFFFKSFHYQQCMQSIHLKISSVEAHCYHWQELSQVSFLLQQTHICCDKTSHLSWQKYACCNKTFIATKLCLLWQYFCHDKNAFVMTSILLLRQNILLLQQTCVTKLLSWQNYVCRNKYLLRQKFCHNKKYTCGSSRQWCTAAQNQLCRSATSQITAYLL